MLCPTPDQSSRNIGYIKETCEGQIYFVPEEHVSKYEELAQLCEYADFDDYKTFEAFDEFTDEYCKAFEGDLYYTKFEMLNG